MKRKCLAKVTLFAYRIADQGQRYSRRFGDRGPNWRNRTSSDAS
jgi:hypothetical protein